ncbi:MAG: hypothetical protein KBG15_02345 [Kofleriaceae bacterium]|nr:hypothetical protein [Kofleriaceae bacterium]
MKGRLLILATGVAVAGFTAAKNRGGAPALSASVAGGRLTTEQPARRAAAPETALAMRPDLNQMQLVGDHYEAPLPDGNVAILTLEPQLQHKAEALLGQAAAPRGAIVAMRTNGAIAALAGQRLEPTGDEPEQFADPNNAVIDYKVATDTWAPAASVFKVITGTALVNNGVRPNQKVCYHGGIRSVVASNLVDRPSDGSCESLTFGIAHSQNAIMAKLAYQKLLPQDLAQAAAAFGFGQASASELPGLIGQISLSAEKDLTFAQNAAGFSGSRLSALGGVQIANTVATSGVRVTPYIVRAVRDRQGQVTELGPRPSTQAIPAATARTVADMMRQTCEVGSAARAFRRHVGFPVGLTAAGKTGTLSSNDPFPMQFSWFVGFAPAQDPEISVSVVLGNSENWRLKGSMVASEMIQRALRKR